MKKIKIYISIVIFIAVLAITNKVNADSSLKLNELKFEAEINADSSMDVVEYWDIDIEDTNTLYKFFATDKSKFSGIENVKVIDITNGRNTEYTKDYYWQYHVTKGHYYGAYNKEKNFEIGWGVGLENKRATRQYKIEYTVKDAITKYSDYAELYWQFIGNGFEVPAKKVTGEIKLPQNASSKEKIKVWGHTEELNGEIYVTSKNTIKFELDGYNRGNMIEVRVLFPTEMIIYSSRQKNKEILQKVIDEETKWAEEANAKRFVRQSILIALLVGIPLIIDIVIVFKIKKYIKKLKEIAKKYEPENKIEYYRDIPREDATPGEAYVLINKLISDVSSYEIGKIFSAGLLDLSLKGYIEFKVNESGKDKITIILTNKELNESVKIGEERLIYAFLKNIKDIENGITVKQLQKEIEKKPGKVESLVKNINKEISKELKEKELVDEKAKKEYIKYQSGRIFYMMFLIWGAMLTFAVLTTISISNIVKFLIATTFILLIAGFVISRKVTKKMNVFTQKGVNEIEEWKGLKKYMKDYSLLNEKEVPEVSVWEKYLVYATAFGIANEVIKQLKLVYPNFEEMSTINSTTLYVAMNTNFNSSFTSAINTSMSRSYSSATGGGGGFSGGGGGGRRPEVEAVDAKPQT